MYVALSYFTETLAGFPKIPKPLTTTLSQAIHEFVRDGDAVALEGFTHLIPFAAGHEIIRQRKFHWRAPARRRRSSSLPARDF